ncbi:NAD-dependent epimerase/dehydratase family protein [Croceimicrobium hydrocarbonivorans]|uniref:NAD(P)-dependent oxidoreductase n=1 Tax=Croceimicrobium hydrocarbonivorans TaxID=2761580 RepID=A0A7H0VFB0_9FLAO|nr:NAD(P)-dependent oxidoreductase [Croceimicrobium hydrocarbonivorans]QNR24408.1 NAD(P)-dependent oxidoreductase [Croceimicrobium hydrocarbonivorans]
MQEKAQESIWVLGATGYVGKALSLELLKDTNEKSLITCFGNRRVDLELMERSNLILNPLEELEEHWLKRFPPKVIYHCARLAGTSPKKRKEAALKGEKANRRLIALLKKMEKPPVIVYCSGTLMYGPQSEEIDESAPLAPTAYAKQYAIAEQPWIEAQQEGILDVRMARPAWIFGPDSWFLHFFLKVAWEHGAVPYYGDGQQMMSLLPLGDCAGQLKHCYQEGEPGKDYNLYGFAPISQKEFAEAVARIMGLPTRNIPLEECLKSFGETVTEALCSNIPVRTQHQAWKEKYQPYFQDLDSLLKTVIDKAAALSPTS